MIQPEQHIQHHHTWSERCIWYLVHSFGAVTILSCIFTGAVVLLIIVFRKIIKEKFGDFLAWADAYVNKKGE